MPNGVLTRCCCIDAFRNSNTATETLNHHLNLYDFILKTYWRQRQILRIGNITLEALAYRLQHSKHLVLCLL